MAQGRAYKQNLVSQLDRVQKLVGRVDQEAAVSSQYRMRDLEKLCQNIMTQLNNLKEQQNTKEFRIDEATKQDLSTRIGEAMAGHVVNNFYSQLSSNRSIDARIRGKPLGWLEDNYPLTGAKLQSRHGR